MKNIKLLGRLNDAALRRGQIGGGKKRSVDAVFIRLERDERLAETRQQTDQSVVHDERLL